VPPSSPHHLLIPIKSLGPGSKKTHPVWQYFSPIHCTHEEFAKNKLVCLLCREVGVNKFVWVGNKCPGPTALLNHVRNCHPEKMEELAAVKKERSVQRSITDHMSAKADV